MGNLCYNRGHCIMLHFFPDRWPLRTGTADVSSIKGSWCGRVCSRHTVSLYPWVSAEVRFFSCVALVVGLPTLGHGVGQQAGMLKLSLQASTDLVLLRILPS